MSAKSALEARLRELIARDAALEKHLRGADGRLEQDFSDRVAFTEMDEVIEQLDDAAREEILAIRRALRRLDEGTYGDCIRCGDAIAPGRLEALPHADTCVSCAA
jgi:RNA polymerase-binding transcription factor DksA